MGFADQKEVAPRGLIRLVIYPREVQAKAAHATGFHLNLEGIPWISSLLVFFLAAGLTFAGVYVREMWSRPAVPSSRLRQAGSAGPGLGLHVQYEGERLLVTWNRGSPGVQSAVQGVLRIEDGGQHRDVVMDAEQIVAGSVLYKPASSDIGFRLEVQNDRGSAVIESIRVLDGGKPPASMQSAPPATAIQPPAAQMSGSPATSGSAARSIFRSSY